MSEHDDPYQRAIEAMKEATASGLDGARLNAVYERTVDPTMTQAVGAFKADSEQDQVRVGAVYRRIEAQLEAQARRHRGWFVGATFAVTAAVVLVSWSLTREVLKPLPEAHIALRTGAVELLHADGTVDSNEASAVGGGAGFRLGAGARVDLDFSGQARVGLRGPTVARLGADRRLAIEFGAAHFVVAKRARTDPFTVQAGDSRVVVRGTRFSIEVSAGRLSRVVVVEGTVELQGPHSQVLHAGESFVDDVSAGLGSGEVETLDGPWFEAQVAQAGYLRVTAVPREGQVKIDGVAVGLTPLLIRSPSGVREVEVASDGMGLWHQQIEVKAGQRTEVRASLEPEVVAVAGPANESSPTVRPPRAPSRGRLPAQETDPWGIAEASLAAKNCIALDKQIRKLRFDDTVRARLMRAECRLRRGDRRGALPLYLEVVEKHPGTAAAETALFESSKLRVELLLHREALAGFEQYLRLYPQGRFAAAASFRLCEVQIDLLQLDRARACLDHYHLTFPREPRAADSLFLSATIARSQGHWAEAADLYRGYAQSLPLPPRREEALFLRIVCLQRGELLGMKQAVAEYLSAYPAGAHAEALRALNP